MRILYHHRTLADGAEGVHIREVVSAFRELGHEVRVLGLAADGGSRSGVAARLRHASPSWSYELASVAANVAEYASIRREAASFHPDFLYKRHARNDVGALSAARALGIPSVLEVNCLFTDADYCVFEPITFRGLSERLERRALSTATRVIAVSTPLAAKASALGRADVTVLPNAANPATFDPAKADAAPVRARLGLTDRFVVGWAGILREWHGLDLLLDAVAAVPLAHLLVVGDGPARAAVEQRLTALNISDRAVIAGRVPHELMPDYIAAMDVAVVAEDRTRVASPMKLLEYMAMGRAVVAPALDNVRDLVADGANGLLFSPGNARSLESSLSRLASDAALRAGLGAHARSSVQELRNWHSSAETIIGLMRGATVPVTPAVQPRSRQSRLL
jgi:glycosyltransferase involved in cell wall biosynthesis